MAYHTYILLFIRNKCYMNKYDSEKYNLTKIKDGIRFNIKVIPNASKCEIAGTVDGNLKIKLNVPPIEGKANKKCIEFISDILRIPKTKISIVSGEKSKSKTLIIYGNPDDLYEKLFKLFETS